MVRFKSHGGRFEVVCDREALRRYQEAGKPTLPDDLSAIIVDPAIFENASKRQQAHRRDLKRAFGDDSDLDAARRAILQSGAMVSDETERQSARLAEDECRKAVLQLLEATSINRWTGEVADPDEVRSALALCLENEPPLSRAQWKDFDATQLLSYLGVRISSVTKQALLPAAVAATISAGVEHTAAVAALLTHTELLIPLSTSEGAVASKYSVLAVPGLKDTSQWRTFAATTGAVLSDVTPVREIPLLERFATRMVVSPVELGSIERSRTAAGAARDRDRVAPDRPGRADTKPVVPGNEGGLVAHDSLSPKMLQEKCRALGLATSGRRDDLLERLQAYEDTVKPRKRPNG